MTNRSSSILRDDDESIILTEPYLQNPTQKSVSIIWQTNKPAYGWVEYGKTNKFGLKSDMVIDGMRNANTTMHKIRLINLESGSTYYYRVCFKPIVNIEPSKVDFADGVYSPTYSFKSLAADNLPVSCVIFNDLHSKFPVFDSLCNALGDRDYQFTIFNGDCLPSLHSQDKVVETLTVYNKGVEAHSRPALYIRGNQEIGGSLARDFKNMFDYPDNEFFFAITAGPVRFIFLDCGSNNPDDHREDSALKDFIAYRDKQKEWLKQETKSAAFLKAKHRVLVHHIPLYNHNNTGVSIFSRTSWSSVLDSVPIDVAISGHTHQYNFIPPKAEGNNYPVLIGGGLDLETATVMVLSATDKQLSVETLNAKGEIVGKYEKHTSGADYAD